MYVLLDLTLKKIIDVFVVNFILSPFDVHVFLMAVSLNVQFQASVNKYFLSMCSEFLITMLSI
jgi:phosphatidylserine decarboxylase